MAYDPNNPYGNVPNPNQTPTSQPGPSPYGQQPLGQPGPGYLPPQPPFGAAAPGPNGVYPNQTPNLEHDVFDTTSSLPDAEQARKHLAAKRCFIVILAAIVIVMGFILWEIIDLILMGAKG